MLKLRKFGHIINIGNSYSMRINHERQNNMFALYVKDGIPISSELDIFMKHNSFGIDTMVSGHYHRAMHDKIPDTNFMTRRHFEVVPPLFTRKEYSTFITMDGQRKIITANSKAVAKIMRFIYDDDGNVIATSITHILTDDRKTFYLGAEQVYESNYQSLKKTEFSLHM